MAMALREVAASVPMAIRPVTPAATASSTAERQSGTSSRWIWVSMNPRLLVAAGDLHPVQLLLNDRVVELLVERNRCPQRVPGRERHRVPAGLGGVLPAEHQVRAPARLVHVLD